MPRKDRPPAKRRNMTNNKGEPTALRKSGGPLNIVRDYAKPMTPIQPTPGIVVNLKKDKHVLPCYHHLLNSQNDIDFLYGGRDSGKSRFVAFILVVACINLPYFRCVLVRKVFNTIKESQWQTIKEVVEWLKLDDYFVFNKNPLEIICTANGNRFICRGLDEPGNLKSIANPSHAWGEEMNQFTLTDFILLMTSLRYNEGKVKTWFTFNPEVPGEFKEHWIYAIFYQGKDIYKTFSATWDIKVQADDGTEMVISYKYGSVHTTYKDNRFCGPERRAFLENLKNLDPYYFLVFTLGQWGNRRIEDPYCYAYDAAKHVAPTEANHRYELICSFDFNVNPITCVVLQNQGGTPMEPRIRVIEALKLHKSDIYELCDMILVKYPRFLYLVTGDASGRNASAMVKDNQNYYTIIRQKLQIGDLQIKVPRANPPLKENRVLVNTVFQRVDLKLDPVKCRDLLMDFTSVGVDENGGIEKGDRANPAKRADFLDCYRYALNAFFSSTLRNIT